MASAAVTPESFAPLLHRKNRKIRRQRKLINALTRRSGGHIVSSDALIRPKRRITKPPTPKQLEARERMKRASAKAQAIYHAAPPGTMKWKEAIAQAWKQL